MAIGFVGTPVTIDWDASTTPTPQDVTVPADVGIAVGMWARYRSGLLSSMASCQLGGVAASYISPGYGSNPDDSMSLGYAIWTNPASGSQSLAPTWNIAANSDSEQTFVMFFLQDALPTPVTLGYSWALNQFDPLSVTLSDLLSGMLVIKYDSHVPATAPSNTSGFTSIATQTNSGGGFSARVAYIVATGATQDCPSEDEDFSAILALAFGQTPLATTAWVRGS